MKEPMMLKRKAKKQNPVMVREFFFAVRSRDYKKVKNLLKDKSLDPDVRDLEDPIHPTALHVACELDDDEMAWILLKSKSKPADVNVETLKGRRPIW